MNLLPNLRFKLKQITDLEFQAMGLLAEIVDDLDDPALRAIITSIIGDENGHIRFFTFLLSLVANDNSQRTCAIFQCSKVEETLQTELFEKTPLFSTNNPVMDIPVSKENPSHYQINDSKTEEKRMDRRTLNQRMIPARVRMNLDKKAKKNSLDISQLS